MKSWKEKLQPGADLHEQERFWKWIRDNVDFRVRSSKV